MDDVLSDVDRAKDPACHKQPRGVLALSSSWCQDGENSVETGRNGEEWAGNGRLKRGLPLLCLLDDPNRRFAAGTCAKLAKCAQSDWPKSPLICSLPKGCAASASAIHDSGLPALMDHAASSAQRVSCGSCAAEHPDPSPPPRQPTSGAGACCAGGGVAPFGHELVLGRREHPAHLEQRDFVEKHRLHATKSSLGKYRCRVVRRCSWSGFGGCAAAHS